MNTGLRLALLVTAMSAAATSRAETIQASSTTLLLGRRDFRDGTTQSAVPLYELVNVVASDVETPFADLEIALSSWGSLDLAAIRSWQNGARVASRASGDVDVAFVRGAFGGERLSLRVGRQMVADGTARMIHLDGAEARARLPVGLGLTAYAGSPVVPRFAARGGELVTGDIRATFASGGRLSWGYPGLLEAGASVAAATDHGEWSREDVGADLLFAPLRDLVFTGSGFWSLFESRLGEASLSATVTPARRLDLTAEFRHVEPDLFLPRNSILAVFTSDERNEAGGAIRWVVALLALDVSYHALLEDAGAGHWGRLKATSRLARATTAGAELSVLHQAATNGYRLVRIFGSHRFGGLASALDLQAYFFERDVNGERKSFTATGTLFFPFAAGWRAAIAGTAGTTPYLSSQFEVMAKLVYERVYAAREVR